MHIYAYFHHIITMRRVKSFYFFDSKTNSGATPLHLAASEGLLDCVETLIQAGADILAQDDMGNTPLDWARMGCHREVAR